MKDHAQRRARLRLIEYLCAGHSWQTAVAQSQSNVSRSTAYRLVNLARDKDHPERAFLDERHGHPYQVTGPLRAGMIEWCTQDPQVPSSRVQSELKSRFGATVSVSQIKRVRAEAGVSHQWRGRAQTPGEKN